MKTPQIAIGSVLERPKELLRSLLEHPASLLLVPMIFGLVRLALLPVVWPTKSPAECISPPFEGCGFIFDEAHYVPAVRRMMSGEGSVNLEHPPLSKWLIMLGILMYGDNPYGWRVPMVVSSSLSIFIAGLLALRLSGSMRLALLAQAFLATDVTFFVVGGIGILDPPAVLFMLLAAYLYASGRRLLAGVSAGLMMLSKSSGILLIPTLLALDAVHAYGRTKDLDVAVEAVRKGIWHFAVPALMVFMIVIGVWDAQTGAFPTPLHHLEFMLSYHSNLKYDNPLHVELPLSWIIPPITRQPSPYYVEVVSPPGYHPKAFWGVSSPLWWSVWLLIPIAYSVVKRERVHNPSPEVFALSWFAVNFGAFALLAYALKRWTYLFYFLQVSPVIAASLPAVLERNGLGRITVPLLALQLLWFVMFFPLKPDWLLGLLASLGLGEVPWI
ncbi:MAG: glycosyltransferase family 39 protein [Nitrososphaerota archaeon]